MSKIMKRNMKALPEFGCFVTIRNGQVFICKMVQSGQRKGAPEKDGYKVIWQKWEPDEHTKPEFLAAINKIRSSCNG